MTLLGVAPSLVILDETTLDDEPECSDGGWVDGPNTDCPNPARWQYRGNCGHPWLVCDKHHDEQIDPTASTGVQCTCGVRTCSEDLTWRHL